MFSIVSHHGFGEIVETTHPGFDQNIELATSLLKPAQKNGNFVDGFFASFFFVKDGPAIT